MFRNRAAYTEQRETAGESPAKWGFRYSIDPEKRLVHVQFGKRLTVTEIGHYVRQLGLNPAFDPNFHEIVDLTQVELLELRGEEILKLADHVDPFSFESKRAFVVRNETHAHQAKMYAISRTARDNIRAFPTMREAERWILLEAPGVTPPK